MLIWQKDQIQNRNGTTERLTILLQFVSTAQRTWLLAAKTV
jgi:hypothetical protein